MKTFEKFMKKLLIIDRLDVGPVVLNKDKIKCSYKIAIGKKIDYKDFTFKFEEDVFDETDEDYNLASLMTAQIAINYGLFCKEIIFHGDFSQDDVDFIRCMFDNTATEIFVNKFLKHNSFLMSDIRSSIPDENCIRDVNPKSFLQSVVSFSSSPKVFGSWPKREDGYAVLSSGGKDSLLSYGLLKEIGVDVVPIFGNESGRHWFTAINAYRYLKRKDKKTCRVWMNSDRMFSWFLRKFPFIPKCFHNIKSDMYPIQLWTVALFIFSALPLLRKFGTGFLIMGNEYDTTVVKDTYGIRHYAGLYDQSRYFDVAMSSYFKQKGWNVLQVSLIRWMSELLIQKTLAERYPELQKHQLSCHSARIVGERARPCGSCEKCRRIISYLVSLGISPTKCGYTHGQVNKCLHHLPDIPLAPEQAVVEHVGWLLKNSGAMKDGIGTVVPKKRPEVLKLRFDPGIAELSDIPNDLRKPLLEILHSHTV